MKGGAILIGQKFGKLLVLDEYDNYKCKCICDCGNISIVSKYNLISGNTKSCGCLGKNNGYSDNLTVDRIDNNKGYEPSNCRWITNKQQSRNRRSNINYTINGETHCLKDWCNILNINYGTVRGRLKLGWSIERALECEVIKND